MIKFKTKLILILIGIVIFLFFFVRYYSFFIIFSNCPHFDESCISEISYYAIDYGVDGVIFACSLLNDKSLKARCYKSALERIAKKGKEENKARKICEAIPKDVKDKYYEQYLIKPLCEPVIFLISETSEKTVEIGETFTIQIKVKNEGKIFKTHNMVLELTSTWITSEEPLIKDISEIPPGEEKKISWTVKLKKDVPKTFWIDAVVKYGKNLELKGPEKGILIHTKRKIIVDGKSEEIIDIDFPLNEKEAEAIVKKFCEPKGYKYDYNSFYSTWHEIKKSTQWKFPTSEPNFSYYALVDAKTGTTNCAVGIKKEWKIYEDENISFYYPPTCILHSNPNGEINITKQNESIPILSFSKITPSPFSLKEWIVKINNKLGNKIISMDPVWEYGINAGDVQKKNHLYYVARTPHGRYIEGLVFKLKKSGNEWTYHFWRESQNKESSTLYLKTLSTIKIKN